MIKISVKLCIGENVVVPTARINAPKADAKAEYKNKNALDTFFIKTPQRYGGRSVTKSCAYW